MNMAHVLLPLNRKEGLARGFNRNGQWIGLERFGGFPASGPAGI